MKVLDREHLWPPIIKAINAATEKLRPEPERRVQVIHKILLAMEAMIIDGWITATHNPAYPLEDLRVTSIDIRRNTDQAPLIALADLGSN